LLKFIFVLTPTFLPQNITFHPQTRLAAVPLVTISRLGS